MNQTTEAVVEQPLEAVVEQPLTLKTLFEAGVHFGHRSKRWNPKMKPYIHSKRSKTHIIDLNKTLIQLDKAVEFVRDVVSRGGQCLLVGTKKQAQGAIQTESLRASAMFVNQRWLGGMLTNFQTIQARIDYLVRLEDSLSKGQVQTTTKREAQKLQTEVKKLNRYLGGIKEITRLPDVIFIVDIVNEDIAVAEARKMGIPIVAVVDTNSDPTSVDHPIPGNDDSVRSINLMTSLIADAIIDGRDRAEILEQERLAADAELENQEMEARALQQAEAASRLGSGSPTTVPESPDSTSTAEVADVDSGVSQIDVSSASGDNLPPQVEIGHSDEKVPGTKRRDVDALSNSPSSATPPDKPSTDAEVSGADVDNEDGK